MIKALLVGIVSMALWAHANEGYRGIREFEIKPRTVFVNRVF